MTRARLTAAPKAESWPAAVVALTAQLHQLEAEQRFAPQDRREEIAAVIRQVTGEIEQAKVAAMAEEFAA